MRLRITALQLQDLTPLGLKHKTLIYLL